MEDGHKIHERATSPPASSWDFEDLDLPPDFLQHMDGMCIDGLEARCTARTEPAPVVWLHCGSALTAVAL
jgi:hypothetical protein